MARTMGKGSAASRMKSMRDKARQRSQERTEERGGSFMVSLPEKVKFWKPKKGNSTFDVVPFISRLFNYADKVEPGDLWYKVKYWAHRNIGAEERPYICPKKTVGKPCPICEHLAEIKKQADADEELIKALRPSERELFVIIPHDGEGAGDLHVWDISYHLFGKMLDEEINNMDEDTPFFADVQGGASVKVRLGEKQFGQNKFLETTRVDFVSRKEDLDESLINDAPDLVAALNIMSYDKLSAIFLELGEGEVEGGSSRDEETPPEEDEQPPPRPSRRAPDPEETPPPEAPPARSRRTPPPPPPPEDSGDVADVAKEALTKLDDMDHSDMLSLASSLDVTVPEELANDDSRKGTNKLAAYMTEALNKIIGTDSSSHAAPPPPPPAQRTAPPPAPKPAADKPKGGDSECPAGGTFGKDCDRLKECKECPKWDACADAS